jgi:hypothetical protein
MADHTPNNDYSRPSDSVDPTPDYQGQIDSLRREMDEKFRNHIHSGLMATRINLSTDLIGLFEVVTVAPTLIPKSPYDQLKIANLSGTWYIYLYDQVGHVWKRAVLA